MYVCVCVRAHRCVSSTRALLEGSREFLKLTLYLLHVPTKKDSTSTHCVARPSDCSSLARFASVNHDPQLCKPRTSASRERAWPQLSVLLSQKLKRNGTVSAIREGSTECQRDFSIARSSSLSRDFSTDNLTGLNKPQREKQRGEIVYRTQIARGRGGKIGARSSITRSRSSIFSPGWSGYVSDECRSRAALASVPIELRLRSSFTYLVNCEIHI